VDEWRDATHGERDWDETVISTLYRDEPPKDEALRDASKALADLWTQLSEAAEPELVEGRGW